MFSWHFNFCWNFLKLLECFQLDFQNCGGVTWISLNQMDGELQWADNQVNLLQHTNWIAEFKWQLNPKFSKTKISWYVREFLLCNGTNKLNIFFCYVNKRENFQGFEYFRFRHRVVVIAIIFWLKMFLHVLSFEMSFVLANPTLKFKWHPYRIVPKFPKTNFFLRLKKILLLLTSNVNETNVFATLVFF